MALASSESSNYDCVSNNHEIEELEITEVDEALLRNILEEAPNEVNREDGGKYAVYNLDANNDFSLNHCEQDLKLHGLHIHNFNWDDTTDITAASSVIPMDEIMIQYVDDLVGVIEFGWSGDYSQYYTGLFSEETNYCRLWQ